MSTEKGVEDIQNEVKRESIETGNKVIKRIREVEMLAMIGFGVDDEIEATEKLLEQESQVIRVKQDNIESTRRGNGSDW